MTDTGTTTNGSEKAKKSKIADRDAIGPDGKPTSDYTSATSARYTFLAGVPDGEKVGIERDFSHVSDPVDRAFAIEGFLNKVGHAVNKAKNTDGGDWQDVRGALEAFEATINAGDWTNREGDPFAGTATLLTAISRARGKTEEALRAAMESGKLDDKRLAELRKQPDIKAAIDAIRAERSAAKAKEATPAATDALADI